MVMAVRIMLMMMMMMVMLVKWVMIMIFAKGMFFFNLVPSERIQNYNPRSIVVTSLQPHFLIASRSLL